MEGLNLDKMQNGHRTIVAGSRSITSMKPVEYAITRSPFTVEVIVHGGADGVDSLADAYATEHGIPTVRFPAHWGEYGESAGPIRNKEMAAYAHSLVAVWDGKSPGTRHMLRTAYESNMPVYLFRTSDGLEWNSHDGKL